MTVFALGVPCLVNVLELNMNDGLHRMSSLHVVQNSKRSYTLPFILFFTSMKQDAQRRVDAEIINSTQQCKIHEIRVTDETVNQTAVPLLIPFGV